MRPFASLDAAIAQVVSEHLEGQPVLFSDSTVKLGITESPLAHLQHAHAGGAISKLTQTSRPAVGHTA